MPVAIVAAHPDDEVLGAGLLLPALEPPCVIIHVTDGAPRSGDDARNAGCATWREYAALRRREFERVLDAVGIKAATSLCLDCPDQQAVLRIADHAERLAAIFDRFEITTVYTHAYEGGHPDHDASAAAVHAAVRITKQQPVLHEFAGYHAGPSGMECECFLSSDEQVLPRPLTPQESLWKREVLNCYASQSQVLAQFPLRHEPLRRAPQYNFTRAPHNGTLYYDNFSWGIRSTEWRDVAARAFQDLRIPCVC